MKKLFIIMAILALCSCGPRKRPYVKKAERERVQIALPMTVELPQVKDSAREESKKRWRAKFKEADRLFWEKYGQ